MTFLRILGTTAAAAVILTAAGAAAQQAADAPNAPQTIVASDSAMSLPDAPSAVAASSSSMATEPAGAAPVTAFFGPQLHNPDVHNSPVAPMYTEFIPAGQGAYPISAHVKLVAGLRDLYSVGNIGAMAFSSGYEQLENSAPNYGSNSTAYGKRFGAAAIRESSQTVFSEIVFADAFHEDPRYYQLGPQYNFFHRTLYAATRVFITRTDSGNRSVNAALLAGYAASTGLNNAYYPQINRNVRDNFVAYGGSLGGAMIGDFISEFTPDVLAIFHHKQ